MAVLEIESGKLVIHVTDSYARLVIGVEDPSAAASAISAAIRS